MLQDIMLSDLLHFLKKVTWLYDILGICICLYAIIIFLKCFICPVNFLRSPGGVFIVTFFTILLFWKQEVIRQFLCLINFIFIHIFGSFLTVLWGRNIIWCLGLYKLNDMILYQWAPSYWYELSAPINSQSHVLNIFLELTSIHHKELLLLMDLPEGFHPLLLVCRYSLLKSSHLPFQTSYFIF